MSCDGTSTDHCCYVKGEECRFLERNTVVGRYWACGLLRVHGTWEAVYALPEWQEHVKPMFDELWPGKGCGDWPFPGTTCEVCGKVNDG